MALRPSEMMGIFTTMFSWNLANQALLAAKAGAAYISPFLGRLDDIGAYGTVDNLDGRATQGVRLMTLGEDDDHIVSVAPVPMEERAPDSGEGPPAVDDPPDEPEDPPLDVEV